MCGLCYACCVHVVSVTCFCVPSTVQRDLWCTLLQVWADSVCVADPSCYLALGGALASKSLFFVCEHACGVSLFCCLPVGGALNGMRVVVHAFVFVLCLCAFVLCLCRSILLLAFGWQGPD
jgi:hypothetical protein